MKMATESFIKTTSLQDNPLFQNHDVVVPLDWDKIFQSLEFDAYSDDELTMIYFLAYLDGESDFDLSAVNTLTSHDKHAMLQALKIAWIDYDVEDIL